LLDRTHPPRTGARSRKTRPPTQNEQEELNRIKLSAINPARTQERSGPEEKPEISVNPFKPSIKPDRTDQTRSLRITSLIHNAKQTCHQIAARIATAAPTNLGNFPMMSYLQCIANPKASRPCLRCAGSLSDTSQIRRPDGLACDAANP